MQDRALCLFALFGVALASLSMSPAVPPTLDGQFARLFAGAAPPGTPQGVVMDVPPALREPNWGGGSCVHASTVTLLRWHGLHDLADWWRAQYSGGESNVRLVKRMEAAGLRYAYTDTGEVSFLEWCCRTGRGAGLFYKPNHAINLVGLDQEYAYLLDNNAISYPESVGHWERVPRAEFESRWLGYGGFAWTLVYSPPPPLPQG